MHPFRYVNPHDAASAIAAVAGDPDAVFIAGGTTLIDLMKENVFRPGVVVNVAHLGPGGIQTMPDGSVRIGANVSNADAARNATLLANYTGVCEAISAGASRQIRNMASVAGNVLQRTRCPYLRDLAQPCNKRESGDRLLRNRWLQPVSRYLWADRLRPRSRGILHCHVSLRHDNRSVRLRSGACHARVHRVSSVMRSTTYCGCPGDRPQLDSNLPHGELIVAFELPPFSGASHYLKARDRASYAFALVSCAVAVEMDGDKIARARIALGSVAHRPWRLPAAEAMLAGEEPRTEIFESRCGRRHFERLVPMR